MISKERVKKKEGHDPLCSPDKKFSEKIGFWNRRPVVALLLIWAAASEKKYSCQESITAAENQMAALSKDRLHKVSDTGN